MINAPSSNAHVDGSHVRVGSKSEADALQAMPRLDVNQLPVVTDDRLEGMVSRDQLLQLIQAHKELRA
jgi:hypothetical protein